MNKLKLILLFYSLFLITSNAQNTTKELPYKIIEKKNELEEWKQKYERELKQHKEFMKRKNKILTQRKLEQKEIERSIREIKLKNKELNIKAIDYEKNINLHNNKHQAYRNFFLTQIKGLQTNVSNGIPFEKTEEMVF